MHKMAPDSCCRVEDTLQLVGRLPRSASDLINTPEPRINEPNSNNVSSTGQ